MKYTHKLVSKDKNKIEIEINLELDAFKAAQDEAYEELSKDIVIPGFRPGKGPKDAILSKLGSKLIDRALGIVLPKPVLEIIEKEDWKPIGGSNYEIVKLDDKGIVYKFSFINFPEFKLGDLKKIKVEKKIEDTKDDEIEMVVKSILRSSLKPEVLAKYEVPSPSVERTKVRLEDNKKQDKKGGVKPEDKKNKDINETNEEKEAKDIMLNDEVVKELGYEKEKTLEDLKKSVKERLTEMKTQQAEEAYITAVVKEVIAGAKYEIPDNMLEQEVERYEHDFNHRLSDLKLDANTYLATQGSSMDKKKAEWKKLAEENIAQDLLVMSVAADHKLLPSDEEIQKEIDSISDPKLKADYDSDWGRNQVRTVMTRRRGLEKLLELVKGGK